MRAVPSRKTCTAAYATRQLGHIDSGTGVDNTTGAGAAHHFRRSGSATGKNWTTRWPLDISGGSRTPVADRGQSGAVTLRVSARSATVFVRRLLSNPVQLSHPAQGTCRGRNQPDTDRLHGQRSG